MAGVLFVIYIPREKHHIEKKEVAVQVEDLNATESDKVASCDFDKTGEAINDKNSPNSVSSCSSTTKRESEDDVVEQTHEESIETEDENVDDKEENEEERHQVMFVEKQSLSEALRLMLRSQGVKSDIWTNREDSLSVQVTFTLETQDCDSILFKLTELGIGKISNTKVSIFPATIHYKGMPEEHVIDTASTQITCGPSMSKEDGKASEESAFMKSIKSRLTVAQVVEGVKNNAMLTFDYVIFIILASILAALGLAESSSVILVASMLVSPLMGPILGWTFGTEIGNSSLWKLGIKTELIGLSLCVLCGFIFGLIASGVNSSGAFWGATDSWPTGEMTSRGLTRSLWVGILIALPSGAGVALSVLGGNSGSLVGVAISASLLPPAVNAGMLWAYAVVTAFHPLPLVPTNSTISGPLVSPVPPDCPQLLDNQYQFVYSCNMAVEAFKLGLVSLFLTILNIICIFFMGILVLKIKEVAPHTSDTTAAEVFWKRDVKVARDSYKTLKGPEQLDLARMANKMVKEWKTIEEVGEENEELGEESSLAFDQILGDIVDEIREDNIGECVPNSGNVTRNFWRQLSKDAHRFDTNDRLHPTRLNYLRATNPAFFPMMTPATASAARYRGKKNPLSNIMSPPVHPGINPFPMTPLTPGWQPATSHQHPPRRYTNEFNNTPVFKLANPKDRRKSKDKKTLKDSPSVESDKSVDKDKEPHKPRFIVTPVNSDGECDGLEAPPDSRIDIPNEAAEGEAQPLMK